MIENNHSFISGAILSKATIVKLINDGSLKIYHEDEQYDSERLISEHLLDETSIDLNIGELYRHSREIEALDIQGKYDMESDYEPILPDESGAVIVEPNDFILGKTKASLSTPNTILGFISERRTAAGNLGIIIKGSNLLLTLDAQYAVLTER